MSTHEVLGSVEHNLRHFVDETIHEQAIESVADQVGEWIKQGQLGRLAFIRDTQGTSRTTQIESDVDQFPVYVDGLDKIIGSFDREQMTVKVGPGLATGTLLREALKVGLMPAVRPGFPALTIQGDTVDHTSWEHGLTADTIVSKTLLLPSGEVKKVNKRNDPELFYATNGDYRTLATVLDVELQLIPAAGWIELSFVPVNGVEAAIDRMNMVINKHEADTVEAIEYGPGEAIVILGREKDDPGNKKIVTFKNASDPWFYQFARQATGESVVTDVISASERFRFGAYWMGVYLAQRIGFLESWVIERFHDNFAAEELYALMHEVGNAWQFFIQDYIGPMSQASALLDFVHEKGIYPIWLNPVKPTMEARNILQPNLNLDDSGVPSDELLVEIGPYGRPGPGPHPGFPSFKKYPFDPRALVMQAEEIASNTNFRSMFYAAHYAPVDIFWRVYDKPAYEAIRTMLGADAAYPDIYEKIHYPPEYAHPPAQQLRGLYRYMRKIRRRGAREF